MKFKRTIEAHVERRDEISRTVCDFCGSPLGKGSGWYDASEVELGAVLGESYPEGDARTRYELDCCPRCFLDRVRPAIEALGVKFRESKADDSEVKRALPEPPEAAS